MSVAEKKMLLKELKRLFKGYRTLNSSLRRQLVNLGFRVDVKGKHYKLYFRELPYPFILAKTPSDRYSGMHFAHDVMRTINEVCE